ncbi:MAG TPA: hypothetical protein VN748_06150 [Pseudonocardiaceae bacterium]|jgi:hypothetical protein|nr:hypothetical protein [Pseudonocardiaceae bacterium]
MTLIVMTIAVIASVIAALAAYLLLIGMALGRTAGHLGECLQSVRSIAGDSQAIGPGISRINQAGGELVGAMPLLLDDADAVAMKMTPAAAAPATSSSTTGSGVGLLDGAPATGVGYLDA